MVLTRGIDRCIAVYPLDVWDVLATRVKGLPIGDPDARRFRRFVFAEAVALRPDAQGRVLIPAPLRSYAAIVRETIIVGVHDSVEIWCPAYWADVDAALDAPGEQIASRLAELM
jgi:MraZ protein